MQSEIDGQRIFVINADLASAVADKIPISPSVIDIYHPGERAVSVAADIVVVCFEIHDLHHAYPTLPNLATRKGN